MPFCRSLPSCSHNMLCPTQNRVPRTPNASMAELQHAHTEPQGHITLPVLRPLLSRANPAQAAQYDLRTGPEQE